MEIHWNWVEIASIFQVMWVKQCHKQPIWEWVYENGDLGDGLLFFYSPSKLWAVMSVVCVQGKTFLEGKKHEKTLRRMGYSHYQSQILPVASDSGKADRSLFAPR
jgi:hypothetical protein